MVGLRAISPTIPSLSQLLTQLYNAQLDEATIMSRTRHHSVDGVRAFKGMNEKPKNFHQHLEYSGT